MTTLTHTSNLTSKAEIDAIRQISDERLRELLQRIKPLVPNHADESLLYEIVQPADVRRTAFRLDPVFVGKADMSKLAELAVITTYHTCAYAMFFKPDIAEVLAQIPTDLIDDVVAFDTLFEGVDIINTDFYGHKAFTRLYRKV